MNYRARQIKGLVVVFAGLMGFMYWYEWGVHSLTSPEVNAYIAKIQTQGQIPGGRHDVPALRKFLTEDDGKPIYTVNMYKFNEMAAYPEGSGFSGSGLDAFDRFSSVMIRLMALRGSHPVFGSDWVADDNADWDRIVIVRYRSRRDLVDLFATDAFADASLHKWASIHKHDRMIVQALHIPGGGTVSLLLASIIAFVSLAIMLVYSRTSPP